MKRILSAVTGLGFLFIAGCHGNDTNIAQTVKTDTSYAIIGKVTGLDTGIIILNHREFGKNDTVALDHGYFKFSGKADTAQFCTISLGNHVKRFFLENGKISMLIKKDSLEDALISGTKVQDEYIYFLNQLSKPLNDSMTAIDKAYDVANSNKNKKAMDSLDKLYNTLDLKQKQMITDYVRSHPASLISAFEISSNFSYNPRAGQLDSLYQLLDTSVRMSYFGKIVHNTLEKAKLTDIGKPAPVFTSNDVNGKPVCLASFKGKYVLVDFWASWCGPCRLENPNVVKAYHKFHDKGFDIFGVSLNETKPEWLRAIKKDGLNWTQVSDLKGWKADAVSLYGIQGIPMNYLLDKNGIIVAKGLRGDELESKLAELLH